jgi:hypothetical protein
MPFKGWFGPKLIGYGFGPRGWQGWLATGVALVVVVGSRFVQPETYGLPHWARPALVVGVLLVYLALAFATYDPDL